MKDFKITYEQGHKVATRTITTAPDGSKTTYLMYGGQVLTITKPKDAPATVDGPMALFKYFPEELLKAYDDGWRKPSWGV